MKILEELRKRAKNKNCTIVLPEANLDERVMQAAELILSENLSKIIVFGDKKSFPKDISENKNCDIIDIVSSEKTEELANNLYELRKAKGLSLEDAQKLIQQPMYFAMMLVKDGLADGVVAGAKFSTADVLRPALQIIKTKPNKNLVTGGMLMLKEDCGPLFFGDVSLVENPTSEQLAEIAIANAEFVEKVLDIEPKVAILIYSTKGSAKNAMVDKVRIATELAQNKGYSVDGEMQVDSALDLATAKKKGITSEVGGQANVLVFPDLNAGNIGYKLVARLGGYVAVGPIMLNFNKPVNDLSRGCTAEEIVNTVLITKLLV
ncbi:MAG: phosphate acetyltransferase [Clostridia bacterium]|nr:phosphate acetyltransferase [Clostridia bacterium]